MSIGGASVVVAERVGRQYMAAAVSERRNAAKR